MDPKSNKGKVVDSSNEGAKRARMSQEALMEDASMPQSPLWFGLRWIMEQEARVKKGQRFSFGGFLTRFLRAKKVEEEEADYRPWHDPKGLDVTKTKEPEIQHNLVLSISERNAHINNILSHLYVMQMLQLRMCRVTEEQQQQLNPLRAHSRALCRVGPCFEEPFDEDDPTNDEQACVDSYLESDADDGGDSEMGESSYSPTDDVE
ncbi:hypothetical protein HAX54_026545 [Datura stramonium]|uniref:Uncharacterized protein n=1 Tax=Datura stramonium TaxID=4076 RepID=A0ABS8V371_DATST|nr:hypothetical protein [Datura stramonium]